MDSREKEELVVATRNDLISRAVFLANDGRKERGEPAEGRERWTGQTNLSITQRR